MREKESEKRKRERRTWLILFSILWVLVLMVTGAMAHLEHETEASSSIIDAMGLIEHGGLFYFLVPYTWGKCLKVSVFYWIFVAMFFIYEQKFRHDAAGIEAGSAKWNETVEEFNEEKNEPFGEKMFSDAPNRPHGAADDSWMEGKVNRNNPKRQEKRPEEVKPVPGNPNMILSQAVRLSTADMKTHANNNMLIVGGAGSGKSRFLIKPNVLQMNCSFVVTDPSGELLSSMRNVLVENGYRIKVFNLVNMAYSNQYNPFHYIHSETDVSIMVDCFMQNTTAPEQKSGDPFWDKSEKAFLSAEAFYLRDVAPPEVQKFSTMLWMAQQAQMDENGTFRNTDKSVFGLPMEMPLDELFAGTKKIGTKQIIGMDDRKKVVLETVAVTDEKERHELQAKIERSQCLTNYKTFRLGGTKTLKSILISAAVRLAPFSNDAVDNLTNQDNVELDTVGDQLTCFFAIIPQTNTTFNFLVSMLFSQMFESLYRKGATMREPNDRLNYHVRFLLDEFANVGKIPNFPQKISTCRKYNLSMTIVLQSIAQLKTLYKDDFETIIGNCDTAICLGTNEQTTADYFSKKLGKATITSRNKSSNVGGKGGGSLSYQQTGRELLMADEIMTMDYTECVVMINHVDPFYDKKYPVEEHPQYQYTGDADPKNAYRLEDDAEFHNVPDEAQVADDAANQEFSGNRQWEMPDPKCLSELLDGLVENDPDSDGYFLVKDIHKETGQKLFREAKEKVKKAFWACGEKKHKTAFYDGESIDPGVAKMLLAWSLNNRDEIGAEEFAIAYEPWAGDGRDVSAAACKPDGNIPQVLGVLDAGFSEEEREAGIFYKTQRSLSEQEMDQFKTGCEKGAGALQQAADEDANFFDTYATS